MREIRVSGESEEEYVKGAKVGGGAVPASGTNTTGVPGTEASATSSHAQEAARRIQELELQLQGAHDEIAQVGNHNRGRWFFLLFLRLGVHSTDSRPQSTKRPKTKHIF